MAGWQGQGDAITPYVEARRVSRRTKDYTYDCLVMPSFNA